MAEIPTECPYKGLQPYTESDREYFFGRESDTIVIASNLIASPLTILYGGSGVGKTSVLLASVVPYLNRKPHLRLTTITFRNWQRTDFALALRAEVLKVVRANTASQAGIQGDVDIDAGLPLDEFLVACINVLRGRLLFIFDQFEEYFLNPQTPQIDRFEAEFARVINRRDIDAHFLLSLREEELSKLDRFQGRIPNLLTNTLRVERLKRQAGDDAIRKPLQRYNQKFALEYEHEIRIQNQLVEALLDKARPNPEARSNAGFSTGEIISKRPIDVVETPVLQILLTRLWHTEIGQGSRILRLQTFNEQLGGAEKIVSAYFSEVMRGLSEAERSIASSIFQFLVTPSGTKITLEPQTLVSWAGLKEKDAQEHVTRLLEKLSSFQADRGPVERAASHQDIRILRKVTATAQPDKYEIFHDVLGNAINEWRTDNLTAKLAGAEDRKKQLISRLFASIGIAIFAAIFALIGFLWSLQAQKDQEKTAGELVDANWFYNIVLATDQSVPLFKAVMRGHRDRINSASFSPDGRFLVTSSADGEARIWEVETASKTNEFHHEKGPITCASFSEDNNFIVTGGVDGSTIVWDADTKVVTVLEGHAEKVIFASFTPGGLIITASRDGTARVWNAKSGKQMYEMRGHTGSINSAAIKRGQPLLLTASVDGTARLWDPVAGKQLQVFTASRENVEVNSAAFSRDGNMIVTGNSDGTAAVWSITDGRQITVLRGHRGSLKSSAFSQDGRLVVTAGSDHTARVWETGSGKLLMTLEGHLNTVNQAAFVKNDTYVVTVSDDRTVRVWDVLTGQTLAELTGHTAAVTTLDVNSNGTLLATASADRTARLWNLNKLTPLEVAKPVLVAEPSVYEGKCPVTIKFTGTISVTGRGGRVRYQFLRDGKENSEVRDLIFDSPGSKEVVDTRSVEPKPLKGRLEQPLQGGWGRLKILEPPPSKESDRKKQEKSDENRVSEKAKFAVRCPQLSQTVTPQPTLR